MTESRDARRRRRQRLVIVGLVVFAMLAGTLAGVIAAFADPSDQPGGTSAVLNTPELDALQARAGQIQGELQDRQAGVANILSRLDTARAAVVAAQTARREADVGLASQQQVISRNASAIYRDGSAPVELRLFLTYRSPADMVAALGYLDAVRSYHEQGLADVERARVDSVTADNAAAAGLARALRPDDSSGIGRHGGAEPAVRPEHLRPELLGLRAPDPGCLPGFRVRPAGDGPGTVGEPGADQSTRRPTRRSGVPG